MLCASSSPSLTSSCSSILTQLELELVISSLIVIIRECAIWGQIIVIAVEIANLRGAKEWRVVSR